MVDFTVFIMGVTGCMGLLQKSVNAIFKGNELTRVVSLVLILRSQMNF